MAAERFGHQFSTGWPPWGMSRHGPMSEGQGLCWGETILGILFEGKQGRKSLRVWRRSEARVSVSLDRVGKRSVDHESPQHPPALGRIDPAG